jgi:hypothetical protein
LTFPRIMILDAIIGLFAELAALLAEGVLKVVFAGANLGLMVIEMVGGLFVEGFRLGRLWSWIEPSWERGWMSWQKGF